MVSIPDGIHPLVYLMVEAASEPGQTATITEPTTEAVLRGMLTENTGRHLLDSGGAYGRQWERNQGRDFATERDIRLTFRWGYIDVTVNVYHALLDALWYEPEGDAFFHAWGETGDRTRESWFSLVERFLEEMLPNTSGIYGEGDHFGENTYNSENLLSQVIQYEFFTLNDDTVLSHPDVPHDVELTAGTYVLLQIHGGCDVRGGYTAPRLFSAVDETILTVGRDATIFCPACGSYWHTDDAYNWYLDGASYGATWLNNHEFIDLSDPKTYAKWRARLIVRDALIAHGEDDEEFPVLGIGYYHYPETDEEEHVGLCPECGVGHLEAQR